MIKVTFGGKKDLESYQAKLRHHDQTTIKTYWGRVMSLNRRSSSEWFLALNRQTAQSSIVSIVPVNMLPQMTKTLPPFRWRQGTVFIPTPNGECLLFGEKVIDASEVGQLHSGDRVVAEVTPEIAIVTPIKKRGRPKGWRKP